MPDKGISSLFQDINEDEIHVSAQSVFNDFLADAQSQVIGVKNADVESIVDAYFLGDPPFGLGKKKSEFPDAITLNVLLDSLADQKAYVVSVCDVSPYGTN